MQIAYPQQCPTLQHLWGLHFIIRPPLSVDVQMRREEQHSIILGVYYRGVCDDGVILGKYIRDADAMTE